MECIAMLLAGGQGSRLGILTKNIAKPAVPYGGKYRIIDFPLSNCVNSGIYTVGVLTQYQPLLLNDYIGNGEPWDLDRIDGGVHILSPYQQIEGTEWYKNTANAIYQNINFVDKYNPEYVVILSGDHIYKMDYSQMLAYHKEKDAACTIAMLEVPWEEASRFGLMNVDEDGTIKEFEEKPKHPKNNKASMGVYMFTWDKLRHYLVNDEADPKSSHDFGHDLIPAMHEAGEKLVAYQFDGYWRDVGTIDSLWASNLDLLSPSAGLNLDDPNWKIYSRSPSSPPQYISDTAQVQNAMLAEGCQVEGKVDFSILFDNVTIEKDAVVRDSIIMPGCTIKSGAVVKYSIIAEDTVVEENACIGKRPEEVDMDTWGITVIGSNVVIGKNVLIGANEMIDSDMAEVSK
ncbi:MAG: glucose-1-phosphate adenylyltransferase [Oscillospiraceae bacterium]